MEAGIHHTRGLAKSSLSLLSGLQGPQIVSHFRRPGLGRLKMDVGGALITSAGP